MVQYYHTRWQRLRRRPSDRVRIGQLDVISRPDALVPANIPIRIQAAMNRAMQMLNTATNRTQIALAHAATRANVRPAVEACFKLPNGAADLDCLRSLRRIRENLRRIRQGLGAFGLQIVDTNTGRAGGAVGYVRFSCGELFRRRNPDREIESVGRIHVDFNHVTDNADNVGTLLIHEAAHKFCGTRDWCYLPSTGGLVALLAGLGPGAALGGDYGAMNNRQALNNADSYAGYVCELV